MRLWGGRFEGETDAPRRPTSPVRSRSTRSSRSTTSTGRSPTSTASSAPGILTADEATALVDGLRAPPRRGRGRAPGLGSGAGGRPPQPRERAHRTDRPGGGQAPHRPLAQRPGRDGPSPLDAPRDATAWTPRSSTSSARSSTSRTAKATAILPGTTHIQPAQPVLFAHHLLAYVEMAERDRGRFRDARARLDVSPLGAGALAGAGYPLDREATAAELGFGGGVTRELARRRRRPRLRRGGPRRRLARDGPPQPAGRGDHLVVEPAVRLRPGRRCVLDGQLDDAQQEEPRPGRAHRAAGRRWSSGRSTRCSSCSRACRSRTSATSRRTSRRCSARSGRSKPRSA